MLRTTIVATTFAALARAANDEPNSVLPTVFEAPGEEDGSSSGSIEKWHSSSGSGSSSEQSWSFDPNYVCPRDFGRPYIPKAQSSDQHLFSNTINATKELDAYQLAAMGIQSGLKDMFHDALNPDGPVGKCDDPAPCTKVQEQFKLCQASSRSTTTKEPEEKQSDPDPNEPKEFTQCPPVGPTGYKFPNGKPVTWRHLADKELMNKFKNAPETKVWENYQSLKDNDFSDMGDKIFHVVEMTTDGSIFRDTRSEYMRRSCYSLKTIDEWPKSYFENYFGGQAKWLKMPETIYQSVQFILASKSGEENRKKSRNDFAKIHKKWAYYAQAILEQCKPILETDPSKWGEEYKNFSVYDKLMVFLKTLNTASFCYPPTKSMEWKNYDTVSGIVRSYFYDDICSPVVSQMRCKSKEEFEDICRQTHTDAMAAYKKFVKSHEEQLARDAMRRAARRAARKRADTVDEDDTPVNETVAEAEEKKQGKFTSWIKRKMKGGMKWVAKKMSKKQPPKEDPTMGNLGNQI